MSTVECHLLCYNEQEILPFTLLHYGTFAEKIIVHDGFSTDRSREIAREYGAEVRDFHSDGVNDTLFKQLKENCWKGTKSDWVITPDADELIYFPEGSFSTLASYEADGVAVVKPVGFEMWSDVMPRIEEGQIYRQVTKGARAPQWYSKPILFRPALIRKLTFSAGSHTCWAELNDGTKISDPQTPTTPETYMLHCHQIGGIDRIARRYAAQQSRHSQTNIKNKWGNFKDPMVHAKEKRDLILPHLEQVIR